MRLVILIALFVPYFLLGGCVSNSVSTGTQSDADAKSKTGTGSSGASNVGTSDTNELDHEISVKEEFDEDGKVISKTTTTKANLKSGSKVSNTNEQKAQAEAVAEASAKASSKAVAEGTASMNMTLFAVLGILGVLFLIKVWDRFNPYSAVRRVAKASSQILDSVANGIPSHKNLDERVND